MKFIFFFLFLSISNAHAFLFIEPIAGKTWGHYKFSRDNRSQYQTLEGSNFGLRAGFDLQLLQLGGDFTHHKYKLEKYGPGGHDNRNMYANEYSAFAGLYLYLLRPYVGYIFDSKAQNTKGKGYKAGISFYAYKNLAVSIEYRKINTESENANGTGISDDYYHTYGVSMSIPIYWGEKNFVKGEKHRGR